MLACRTREVALPCAFEGPETLAKMIADFVEKNELG